MRIVRKDPASKTANSDVHTIGNEVVATLKSIARHYGGEYKPTLAGGSITLPDSPLVITRIGTTGRTPKNHVEVTIENLPLIGYSYEVDDYRTFSQATQSLSSVATNMKVRYLGETGARCTFDVNVDNISKFSTMFQNAVLKMFPEKSAPSRTAAPRKKSAPSVDTANDIHTLVAGIEFEAGEISNAMDRAYHKHDPLDAKQLGKFVNFVESTITKSAKTIDGYAQKVLTLHQTLDAEADTLRSQVAAAEEKTKDASDSFADVEDRLDKIVRALRDFERKHPEISGYDFDDLVGDIENLSDDARAARFEALDV